MKSLKSITKYARLPSEYQEVEYLESTGTQYIDTGVNPTNDYGIKVVVSNLDEESQDFNYLGARTSSVRFAISYYQGKHGYGWGSFYTTNETFNVNEKTTVALNYNNSGKFNVNGNDIATLPSTTISGLSTILIFAQNTQNGPQPHNYRIYNVSITNGENIVRNFVPCYRKSDNEIGLYDLVNSQFYTNAGTGTFAKGADIITDKTSLRTYTASANINLQSICEIIKTSRLPSTYQEIEYLESSGTQYIDTGITDYEIMNSNIEIQFEFVGSPNNDNGVFGFHTLGGYGTAFGIEYWSRYQAVAGQLSTNSIEIGNSLSNVIRMKSQTQDGKTTSVTVYQNSISLGTITGDMGFNFTNYNSLHTIVFGMAKSLWGTNKLSSMKLASMKIFNSNDVLVRDFIPCYRKLDNVAGLYDLVTNTFFTNAGTGTFSVGGDIN